MPLKGPSICHLRHGSQVGAVPTVFTQETKSDSEKSGPIESHEEATGIAYEGIWSVKRSLESLGSR